MGSGAHVFDHEYVRACFLLAVVFVSKPNPRYSNGARRRAIRKRWRSIGAPCSLCGKPIDYSLPAGHPMSFEVDEIIPVSRYLEGGYASPQQCALDFNNTRPVHRICNQRRGNGKARFKPPTNRSGLPNSRQW